MSATLLAAAASVCAVLGFGFALVIHIIKYSYAEGKKDQRIKTLEDGQATLLSTFKETLERIERHFNQRMDDFKAELEHTRANASQAKDIATRGRARSDG